MLSNKELAKLYICRRCLNEHAKIRFKNYELNYKYYYYHFKCSQCEAMHHIVKSVKPIYIWKLLFIKKPDISGITEDPAVEKAIKRRQLKIKFKKWLHW